MAHWTFGDWLVAICALIYVVGMFLFLRSLSKDKKDKR